MASDKNFMLGNMADDLVSITIELTGKKEDRTPRFPRYIYDSYVTRMMNIALDIQADIVLSNELYSGHERQQMQKDAMAKCVLLEHYVRLAESRGWISEKQRVRWLTLVNSVKFKTRNWMRSDASK